MAVVSEGTLKSREGIVIYCNPVHPMAREAEGFLKARGARYEVRDVTTSAYHAEHMLRSTGQNSLPLIEAGGKAIVGFDDGARAVLESALKTKA